MRGKRYWVLGGYVAGAVVWACSGSSSPEGFGNPGSSSGGSSGGSNAGGSSSGGANTGGSSGSSFSGDGGSLFSNDDGSAPSSGTGQDASVTVTTTIYANTDDSLYSVDPKTNAVTLVGAFSGGLTDASTNSTITDVAVNAAGEVYVNSESAVYKATLPATAPGPVVLTLVSTIAATSGTRFYALAFAPAGALGATEMLVGGDGNGNLWSIDLANGGKTIELGSFGDDPTTSGNILALSGDVVFYTDSSGKFQGLATIRSCKPAKSSTSTPTCSKTDDYLAGVDMTALATAFSSGTPAASLNNGIYGGSATALGAGIGHGEVFGLGAVEGNVIGFSRYQTADAGVIAPALWAISTGEDGGAASGSGTSIPGTFSFTNGWSGAGVTSKVTIVVPPPPPPPPAPK